MWFTEICILVFCQIFILLSTLCVITSCESNSSLVRLPVFTEADNNNNVYACYIEESYFTDYKICDDIACKYRIR